MAKVQRVRFTHDSFEAGAVKFRAGEHYPLCPDSMAQVLVHNHAALVDVDMDARDHERQTAAAHAAWNERYSRTIQADRELRTLANPAQVLVDRHLEQLRTRGAI